MPVRVSPSDATTRWVSQLGAAGARITAGVQAVTKAPGAAAAEKFQKWVQSLQDPAVQQKWRVNVGAVSLQEWQQLMTEVGIPRIATGAQAKQGKYQAFAESFFPFLARNVAQVEAMDDSTFQARVQRAVQMMTLNHGYKGKGS